MGNKPWKPSLEPRSANLNLPNDILPPIKYPDFGQMRPSEKLDIFTDEMAMDPTIPVEMVMESIGMTIQDYKEIVDDQDYMRTLHKKCIAHRVGPRLAAIYDKMAVSAEAGDPVMMKMVMSTGADITPDNLTVVNQNLVNMSNDELKKELEFMQSELDKIGKDD